MDFSKEYILMCEKADQYIIPTFEIKTIGYLKPGIVWQDGNCFYNQFDIVMPSNRTKLIWLPRQDQLQEMIKPNNLDAHNEFTWKWRDDSGGQLDIRECTKFNTLEQAWLSFVMETKHNKTWNGEDWI